MKIKYFSIGLTLLGCFVANARVVDVVDSITVNPTNITNYDYVNIDINWTAKGMVEVGDTFTVTLPSQIKTINTSTAMLSLSAQQVGNCSLVGQDITCTFSKRAVLGGKISLYQQFEDITVTTPNTTVPTTYNVNGTPNTNIDMTVSPSVRDPNEILTKFGDLDKNGASVGNTIEWYARVNCRADNVDNMVISDEIELGHELDLSSIYILEGKCDAADGGFNAIPATEIYDATPPTYLNPNSKYNLSITGPTATNGGKIELRIAETNNSNAYQLTYNTTITNLQAEWHNDITLTGDGGLVENIDSVVSQEIMSATGYLNAPLGDPKGIPSLGLFAMLMMILSVGGIAFTKFKRKNTKPYSTK